MQVNKVIYILLALFLGSFGIHKFYAGKNMQGILHLIFCWTGIPHILAIISAVITVFKPADEQVMSLYKLIKINPDDNHLLFANHRVIVITNSM